MPDDQDESPEARRRRLAVQSQNPVSSGLGYAGTGDTDAASGSAGILAKLGAQEPRDPRYLASKLFN